MTKPKRPRRQRKADRLLNPGSTKNQIACDYAIAPMDRLATEMERKWGIDQLPALVSVETAQRYGNTMAMLNEAIETSDPEKCADAANRVMRGLRVMDEEATAAGHQPATGEFWEYELPAMDGHPALKIAIIKDGAEWRTLKDKRPDLQIYTMREVANAMKFYQQSIFIQETKKHFPGAQVAKIKPNPPVSYATGGDDIPEF